MARRSDRAASALAHLPESDPILAALALWCDMRDGTEAQTFVSGDTIHVGTGFTGLPLREQIGLLGHHVLHVALRHEYRMQDMAARWGAGFDANLHNLCSDAVINECLTRGGLAIPRPSVLLSALCTHAGLGSIDAHRDVLSQWDVDRLYSYLHGASTEVKEQIASYCKSVSFEPDIHARNAALRSDRYAGEWHARLIRAARSAGAAGRGVGVAMRQIFEVAPSRTPWEGHLRGLLSKAINHTPRRSYRRPRSKWIASEAEARRTRGPSPVFEPAEDRRSLRPRLVVGIDASGSVSTDILTLFVSEIIGMTRKSNAETHILAFDEEVFAHRKVELHNARAAFENLPFRQDGGTSFLDVLEKADALAPSLIVVLTDLAGEFGKKPSAPVLWATPISPLAAPPFGDVLQLLR